MLVHVRKSQAEDIEWGNDLGVMWGSDPIANGHHLGIAAMLEKTGGWKQSKLLKLMQLNEDL